MNAHETVQTGSGTETQSAHDRIEEIRQEVAVMGANDSEFWQLSQIQEQLHAGTLTSEEAVHRAQKILADKQDYH